MERERCIRGAVRAAPVRSGRTSAASLRVIEPVFAGWVVRPGYGTGAEHTVLPLTPAPERARMPPPGEDPPPLRWLCLECLCLRGPSIPVMLTSSA